MGEIRFVEDKDKAEWYKFDNHLCEAVFEDKVRTRKGYVYIQDGKVVGILRYNLFWDNTPFCTLLFVDSLAEEASNCWNEVLILCGNMSLVRECQESLKGEN